MFLFSDHTPLSSDRPAGHQTADPVVVRYSAACRRLEKTGPGPTKHGEPATEAAGTHTAGVFAGPEARQDRFPADGGYE